MTQEQERSKQTAGAFKTKVIVGLVLVASIQISIYLLLHSYR